MTRSIIKPFVVCEQVVIEPTPPQCIDLLGMSGGDLCKRFPSGREITGYEKGGKDAMDGIGEAGEICRRGGGRWSIGGEKICLCHGISTKL